MNEKEIERLQRQSDNVYQNLTGTIDHVETEKGALENYTRRGFAEINGVQHDPSQKEKYETFEFDDWSQVERVTEYLDSALAKFNLESDITVFRGDEPAHFKGWDVGDVKPYPAFMSTTVLEDKAEEFASGLKIEIFVPKGARGMYIGTNSAVHKEEAEFLLGRGLNFRVLERTKDTLKLEVLL